MRSRYAGSALVIFLFVFLGGNTLASRGCDPVRDALSPASILTGSKFRKGERVWLSDGKVYEIVQRMDAGEDRRVYRVRRETDGREFALKHARTHSNPKGKLGLEKERETVAALARLGIRHPPIEASGEDWMLRDWVDGELGEKWFLRWQEAGYPETDPAWQRLIALVTDTANRGIAIGAMDFDDIVLKDGEWVVIDSGRVREFSREEAWSFYRDDLVSSWCDKIDRPDFRPILLERLERHQKGTEAGSF